MSQKTHKLLILLLILPFFLLGQSLRVAKIDYDIHNGLLGMQVVSLFQDSKGQIIVGTKSGACVFDGQNFHSRKTGIPLQTHSFIHKVIESSDRKLWMSTDDGIIKYDGRSTESIAISDDYLPEKEFVKGENDVIYFINKAPNKQGEVSFDICKIKDNKVTTWDAVNDKVNADEARILKIAYVRELKSLVFFYAKKDPNASRDHQIVLVHEETGKITSISSFDKTQKSFHRFLEAKNGAIYLLLDDSIYKIKNEGLELIVKLPNKRICYQTHLIVNDSLFYSGGEKGRELYKIQLLENDSIFITDMGVDFTLVDCMLLGDDGRIWIGKEDGLSVIPNEAFWEYPYNKNVRGVWTIAQDKNNDIWFGSYGYGLSKYYYDLDSFKTINLREHGGLDTLGARHMYFGSLKDSKGDIYFPMSSGALKYDVDKNSLIMLNSLNTWMATLYAYEDNSNRYILFGSQDIIFYDKKRQLADTLRKDRFGLNSHIRAIIQDENGDYWMGGRKGLWIGTIDLQDQKTTSTKKLYKKNERFKGEILSLLADSKKNIWIGTKKGLYQYQRTEDTFLQVLPTDLEGSVSFISEMSDSTFLLTSTYELIIYNVKNGSFRSIGIPQGFTGVEFAQNGVMRDHEGFYWMPHSNKVIRFNPNELPPQSPPKSYIVDVLTKSISSEEWISNTTDTIDSSNERIRIQFSAISFDLGKDFKYEIRLMGEGRDSLWSPQEEKFIDYDNLPYGDYTFELKVCSETTSCETKTTLWKFYIKSSFLERYSILLIILGIILFIMLFVLLARIYSKWQSRVAEKRRQEAVIKIKALNNQLDPHFLFNVLNNINGIIEQKDIKYATQSVSKLALMLRDSVISSSALFRTIEEELKYVRTDAGVDLDSQELVFLVE